MDLFSMSMLLLREHASRSLSLSGGTVHLGLGPAKKRKIATCPKLRGNRTPATWFHRCPFWLFWWKSMSFPGLPGGLFNHPSGPSISPKRTPMPQARDLVLLDVRDAAEPGPRSSRGCVRSPAWRSGVSRNKTFEMVVVPLTFH